MGRFVTPAGVVIELGDAAARAVGFKVADAEVSVPEKSVEKPTRKARQKKSEE